MTVFYARSDIEFTSEPNDSDEAFDAFLDRFEDALINLEDTERNLVDPSIAASLRDRTASVLMGLDVSTAQEARELCSVIVRAALHDAECDTPGWPTFRPAAEAPRVDLVDA